MRLNWKKASLSLTALCTSLSIFSAEVLAAPVKSTTTPYVVQSNDTFWTMSRQFHVSVASLLSANPSTNPLNLYSGLIVQIPHRQTQRAHAIGKPDLTGSKVISCVATAYTASPSENGWGPVDYFGNPLKVGTIAVDPSVIPLGSTAYVTGYSYGGLPSTGMLVHATDEGSAIRGNRIDIFVPGTPDTASTFGIQNVKVYIIK